MAHTTISPPSRRWSPAALRTGPLSAAHRVGAMLRPRWMLAALMVTATAVGVLALEVSESDLVRDRDALVARSASLEEAVQTAQRANALTRIRVSDLRAVLALQADELASTEGFLK